MEKEPEGEGWESRFCQRTWHKHRHPGVTLPGFTGPTCKSRAGKGKSRAEAAKQGWHAWLEGTWGLGEELGCCPVKWETLGGELLCAWHVSGLENYLMSCVSESSVTISWRDIEEDHKHMEERTPGFNLPSISLSCWPSHFSHLQDEADSGREILEDDGDLNSCL